MTIGESLRQKRLEQGWSQADLAERADVSENYVWRVETGRSARPGLAVVKRLADALGCSVDELAGDEPSPQPTPLTPLQKRALGLLEQVPPKRVGDWFAEAGRLAAEDQEAAEDFAVAMNPAAR